MDVQRLVLAGLQEKMRPNWGSSAAPVMLRVDVAVMKISPRMAARTHG
jgi:hypothetical protein